MACMGACLRFLALQLFSFPCAGKLKLRLSSLGSLGPQVPVFPKHFSRAKLMLLHHLPLDVASIGFLRRTNSKLSPTVN